MKLSACALSYVLHNVLVKLSVFALSYVQCKVILNLKYAAPPAPHYRPVEGTVGDVPGRIGLVLSGGTAGTSLPPYLRDGRGRSGTCLQFWS